ncbi:MAG: nucleotidyltransferase domain-containing protein [Candidatus Cloacimonetes bacterium]|nr:nucleotidyltransferase domain-containing protein [Candidatus Cloacimonadota bacterium]MCF7813875.1 nucleotidyltransferase domain-containing protein [Candidatus Cloacimonadota bacterium]MCF7868914.1 nucleotidyltransferase domain-containing protein [Candidatus Cloacimonadota bacterium]MCF7883987.1 nucleotidyltransferase domain-containing protein [Candidatus Cloacimonadota bacterium]
MKFGLTEKDIQLIQKAAKKFENIEKIIIFGSRSMGNYKNGSDIDLALVGKNISDEIMKRFTDLVQEEYPLPYFFDIVSYNTITNIDLLNHIKSEGKILYTNIRKTG